MESGNPGSDLDSCPRPAQQPWKLIYQHCHEPPALVLPAKLWQHQHIKSPVKSKENCHLSAEFTVGLSDRKEFSTETVPWSLAQEKAQEIDGRGNGRAAVLSRLPPHWATPGSPQLPSLHPPNPPIADQFPEPAVEFQTRSLSPTHLNFRSLLFPST